MKPHFFILVMLVALPLLLGSAAFLFAKEPASSGDGGTSYYVSTPNHVQPVGGRSQGRSSRGLSRAAERSQSVKGGKTPQK